jgi:hypothetical protein
MTAISSTDIASTPAESPRPKLDQPMGIRTILIFLAIMALGLFFAAYNIYRNFGVGDRSHQPIAFPASRRRPADRARLRIRQRVSRYGERGRDCHLHALARSSRRGGLVGFLQFLWGSALDRRGRLRDRFAIAGRADSSSRLRSWIRDGLRDADRRDHLESRDMVAGPAGIKRWLCRLSSSSCSAICSDCRNCTPASLPPRECLGGSNASGE